MKYEVLVVGLTDRAKGTIKMLACYAPEGPLKLDDCGGVSPRGYSTISEMLNEGWSVAGTAFKGATPVWTMQRCAEGVEEPGWVDDANPLNGWGT